MITNDDDLQTTLDRIARFHAQIVQLRHVETNPVNYKYSASGFLSEIDRMQTEVRDYLQKCPSEIEASK